MSDFATAQKMIADIRTHLANNYVCKADVIAHRAIARFPGNAELLFLSGHIALKTGEFAAAISHLERAVKVIGDDAEIRLNQGMAYQSAGRLAEATQQYRTACRLDPGLVQAFANLGFSLRAQGDLGAALEAFYKALRLNPHHVGAAQGMSSILGRASSAHYAPAIADLLVDAFGSPYIEYALLAPAAACQLTHLFAIGKEGRMAQPFDAGNALLSNYLTKCINIDPALEFALTAARCDLVFSPAPNVELAGLLAIQCFINEYVFALKEDEQDCIRALKTDLEKALKGTGREEQFWRDLCLFAMYAPLFELDGAFVLLEETHPLLDANMQLLIELALANHVEEQTLRAGIVSFSPIENETSKKVRGQYEANPYPRWTRVPAQIQAHPGVVLKAMFPHFSPPSFLKETARILIAGSGTGQHVAHVALKYPNAKILTFDLSKSSLAYAKRMAAWLGITNVEFRHGDILQAARLEGVFDIIEAIGVLHHMKQPVEGWRVLAGLLREGGVFRTGLYSARGRRGVFAARDVIAREGIGDSAEEIIAFRQRVLRDPADGAFERIKQRVDFYTTSNCRDLLFHVHEDNYTPQRLHDEISELGLEFIGFEEYEELGINAGYRALFGDDPSLTNLVNWEAYEKTLAEPPEGYVFWCQKPEN